jgi:hypothetical protein
LTTPGDLEFVTKAREITQHGRNDLTISVLERLDLFKLICQQYLNTFGVAMVHVLNMDGIQTFYGSPERFFEALETGELQSGDLTLSSREGPLVAYIRLNSDDEANHFEMFSRTVK